MVSRSRAIHYPDPRAPGPFAVENAYEPPWTVADDPEPGFVSRERLSSFIAAPILDHLSGDPRGVLVIGYRSQRSIDERDRRLSGSFAELAGQAMRNYDERALLEREQESLRPCSRTRCASSWTRLTLSASSSPAFSRRAPGCSTGPMRVPV